MAGLGNRHDRECGPSLTARNPDPAVAGDWHERPTGKPASLAGTLTQVEQVTAPTTVASGFTFLEAPRWHDDRLFLSDFYAHRVLSAREDGSDLRTEAVVPGQPSGLGWLPDGRLLVVSMLDRRVLRREADGTLVTHADLRGYATT